MMIDVCGKSQREQKLLIRGKKTKKRREFHFGRNAYFSVCHNMRSIGPTWDFDLMYS